MDDHSVGGEDTYIGGGGQRGARPGDALTMSGSAKGGDDTLIAGNDPTPPPAGSYGAILVGDAQTMSGTPAAAVTGSSAVPETTICGGRRSGDVGGNARGANDTFVFNFNNGSDKIEDFGQGVRGAGPNLARPHRRVCSRYREFQSA